jgi:predicted secreted protein
MATGGYSAVLSFSTDDSTYNAFDGITSFSGPLVAEELDTTDFADTQWRTSIQGLKSIAFSIEGDYEPSDTAQSALRTAFTSGATVYIKILFDGTNGYKCACKVYSWNAQPVVDAKTSFSAELKSVAAPTFLP